MTALGTTASENATTALRAAANQEAVRTGTLDLGRLIGTFGSHDFSSIGMNFSGITDMPSEVKTQEMGTAGSRHALRGSLRGTPAISLRTPMKLCASGCIRLVRMTASVCRKSRVTKSLILDLKSHALVKPFA